MIFNIKKLISLILLTAVVIFNMFSLISCANDREYDEETVLSEAKRLIEKSILLNEIYYGEGIAYEKNDSYADGSYYPADSAVLKNLGIETLDDIKEMTKEVFSKELSGTMIDATLSSIYEGDEIKIYSRYYQKFDSLTNEPVSIMVYSSAKVLLTDDVEYDFTTLKATGSKRETVYVEIKATATRDDGESSENTLSIGLIEEENGWRLCTPTYTSYSDEDYYNDLQKN